MTASVSTIRLQNLHVAYTVYCFGMRCIVYKVKTAVDMQEP